MEFRTLSQRIKKDHQISNLNEDYKNEEKNPITKIENTTQAMMLLNSIIIMI